MTQMRSSNPADTEAAARRRAVGRTGGYRGFVAGSTEARPGIMTTEFWLSLIGAVVVIVAGYVSDAFDVDVAWALGIGLLAAYALSRGFAKAGSREGPFLVDLESERTDA